MSKQVLSIEQMHHLQELGLDTSKSSFCRFPETIGITDDGFPIFSEKEYIVSERELESRFNYPAFTLQDILDLLPKTWKYEQYTYILDIFYNSLIDEWCIGYSNGNMLRSPSFKNTHIIDAAYEMLC